MVDIRLIPRTECLKDTFYRVLPYWYDTIVPEIKVRKYLPSARIGSTKLDALRTACALRPATHLAAFSVLYRMQDP